MAVLGGGKEGMMIFRYRSGFFFVGCEGRGDSFFVKPYY